MELTLIAAVVFFVVGLFFIVFDQFLKHKAAIAAALFVVLWLLRWSMTDDPTVEHEFADALLKASNIAFFLMGAMGIVILIEVARLFDWVAYQVYRRRWSDKKQYGALSSICFWFSAVLDNMTTALVMSQISPYFFRGKNLKHTAPTTTHSANAGGAWSPIGDVTTIMIWVAGKFAWHQVVFYAFAPSFASFATFLYGMSRKIEGATEDVPIEPVHLTRGEVAVISSGLVSFTFPLIAVTLTPFEPWVGLWFGFAITWLIAEHLRKGSGYATSLDKEIEEKIKDTDVPAIIFFVGIVLAADALGAMGILRWITEATLGDNPSDFWVITTAIALGVLSAGVDNVPLTAIALDTIQSENPELWALLAYCVGTGGSILITGSAAGVVVMSRLGVSAKDYARDYGPLLLLSYFVGVVVAVIQYLVLSIVFV